MSEEPMQSAQDVGVESRTALDKLPPYVREHIVWILGLFPFLFAAVQVIYVSGGDPTVAGYMLKNLNVVTVLLAVSLPLISTMMTVAALYHFWLAKRTPKEQRGNTFNFYGYLAGIGIGIGALSMPLFIFAFLSVLIAVFWVIFAVARRIQRKNLLRFGESGTVPSMDSVITVSVLLLPACFVLTAVLVMYSSMWLPREKIDVKGQESSSGQVLSSDGDWTIYLESTTNRRTVRIVRTTDVISRTPCNEPNSVVMLPNSVGSYIFLRGRSGPLIDCPG